MANIFSNFTDWLNGKKPLDGNLYNKATLKYLGGQSASYDYDNDEYLTKGFGLNPDVYAIITQKSKKFASIPFYVKEIEDKQAKRKLDNLQFATKGNYSTEQLARKIILETKAYSEEDMDFPLNEPNPLQSWSELDNLFEIFINCTGNVYYYMEWAEDGPNAGVPKQVYMLPAHKVKIVLKKDADLINDESPIDYYMLVEGDSYIQFPAENIMHVKYANPFFDMQGRHLYGLSPLHAVLRNIESSNEAINGNIKTLKNSGVFGFLSSSDVNKPWNAEQANQMKEKLREMDRDSARLSKIAAGSGPVEFTKLSLTTDELKPFDFLDYDQKTIANVLGWSVMLLNSGENMTYNNLKNEKKRVLIDSIQPDLKLRDDAFNKYFLPRFKGYENAEMQHDITEAPEMQEDYKEMLEWMNLAPLTPNEIRTALKYETIEEEGMDVIWIPQGKKRIDDADVMLSDINRSFEDEQI